MTLDESQLAAILRTGIKPGGFVVLGEAAFEQALGHGLEAITLAEIKQLNDRASRDQDSWPQPFVTSYMSGRKDVAIDYAYMGIIIESQRMMLLHEELTCCSSTRQRQEHIFSETPLKPYVFELSFPAEQVLSAHEITPEMLGQPITAMRQNIRVIEEFDVQPQGILKWNDGDGYLALGISPCDIIGVTRYHPGRHPYYFGDEGEMVFQRPAAALPVPTAA